MADISFVADAGSPSLVRYMMLKRPSCICFAFINHESVRCRISDTCRYPPLPLYIHHLPLFGLRYIVYWVYTLHQTQNTDTKYIQQLNTYIDAEIKTQQKLKWQKTLDTINFPTNANKLWRLIKGLNTKYMDHPNTHESLAQDNTILSSTQQANALNKHYASTSRLPTRPQDRHILRRLHKTCTNTLRSPPFTPAMVTEAIRATNNTSSTGPDGISNKHLKHLGPHAVRASQTSSTIHAKQTPHRTNLIQTYQLTLYPLKNT